MALGEKEQALLKKRLEALLKQPGNITCADCPSRCASPPAPQLRERARLGPLRRVGRLPRVLLA